MPLGGVRFINFDRSAAAYVESTGPPVADTVSDEVLGSRQISGVETTGRRVTKVVPVGVLGNDKPIEIVDERWESQELKLLIYSRFSNSSTGDIEYLLTNIRRLEPPPALFEAGRLHGPHGTVDHGSVADRRPTTKPPRASEVA